MLYRIGMAITVFLAFLLGTTYLWLVQDTQSPAAVAGQSQQKTMPILSTWPDAKGPGASGDAQGVGALRASSPLAGAPLMARLCRLAQRMQQESTPTGNAVLPVLFRIERAPDPRVQHELAALPSMRQTVKVLQGVLSERIPGEVSGELPVACRDWRYLIVLANVLRERLVSPPPGESLSAKSLADLGLRLLAYHGARANRLEQLGSTFVAQRIIAGGVQASIQADRWAQAELLELVQQPLAPDYSLALARALVRERQRAVADAAHRGHPFPRWLQPLLFQPNRSRAYWAAGAASALDLLASRQLAAAAAQLQRLPTPFRQSFASRWLGRNALGFAAVYERLNAGQQLLARAVEAALQLQLVELRAGLQAYRARYGAWPASLTALRDEFPRLQVHDPWTADEKPLRYRPHRGEVYSIGPDGLMDKGANELMLGQSDGTGGLGPI